MTERELAGLILVGLVEENEIATARVFLSPEFGYGGSGIISFDGIKTLPLVLPYAELFVPFGYAPDPILPGRPMVLQVIKRQEDCLVVSERLGRAALVRKTIELARLRLLSMREEAESEELAGCELGRYTLSGHVVGKVEHHGQGALSMVIPKPWIGAGFHGVVPVSRLPGDTAEEQLAFFNRVQPPKVGAQATIVDLIEVSGKLRLLLSMRSTRCPHMIQFED